MKKERRRINISLEAKDYQTTEELARAGGYKNACAFVRALLVQLARYAERQREKRQQQARAPTPIEEEIDEIFTDLLDWDAATPGERLAALMSNEKHPNDETQT